jgi:hypothetical protein
MEQWFTGSLFVAKGNNGLVRTKYITFSIEAKSVREAKPRLERIETDILNNFKVLGVKAYPLNGVAWFTGYSAVQERT